MSCSSLTVWVFRTIPPSKRNVGAKQQLVALTPWVMSADTGLGDGDECAVT